MRAFPPYRNVFYRISHDVFYSISHYMIRDTIQSLKF